MAREESVVYTEQARLLQLGWSCSTVRSDSNDVARWTLTAERGGKALQRDVWVSYMELRAAVLDVAGMKQQQAWRDILAVAETQRSAEQ